MATEVLPLQGCKVEAQNDHIKRAVSSHKMTTSGDGDGDTTVRAEDSRFNISSDVGGGARRDLLSMARGGARCRVDGVEVPPLHGLRFLAVENLYWTAKVLGLHQEATLQELYDAGGRHCSIHWASLHAQFSGHVPDQFLTRYCFGAGGLQRGLVLEYL